MKFALAFAVVCALAMSSCSAGHTYGSNYAAPELVSLQKVSKLVPAPAPAGYSVVPAPYAARSYGPSVVNLGYGSPSHALNAEAIKLAQLALSLPPANNPLIYGPAAIY